MSEVDYSAVTNAIRDVLLSDDRTKVVNSSALTVAVEGNMNQNTANCPWVGVYLDSWDSAAVSEQIGSATPFFTLLTFELWLYEFGLEDETANKKRDNLLRKVKEVLKANRTVNGTVRILWFKGGVFDAQAAKSGGFFRGASLKIQCEIRE